MDCWTNLVEWIRTKIKIIMIVSTILFCFVGFAITGCGIYLQVKLANYLDLVGDLSGYSAILLIVVGGIMLTISFIGFIGARLDRPCLLKTFACLIGIILFVQIIGIIILFSTNIFQEQLQKGLENYNTTDATGGVAMSWDWLQQEYECCGVTEPHDWKQRFDEDTVPDSCCKKNVMGCGKGALSEPDNPDIYLTGCTWKLADVTLIASVGGILGILQLLGIFVACCMARTSGGYEKANTDIEMENVKEEN